MTAPTLTGAQLAEQAGANIAHQMLNAVLNSANQAEAVVSGPAINAWPGGQGIYHLLAFACDVTAGFNEMFTADEEDGPWLILRPTPWRTPAGDFVQSDVDPLNVVEVMDVDLVGLSSTRTDQAVANLFWVRAPHFDMINDERMRLIGQLAPMTEYQNVDPHLYGFRQMQTSTAMGSPDYTANQGDHEAIHNQQWENEEAWMRERLRIITDAAKDSVVFEKGTMRLKGNERIKAGMVVRLHRGALASAYYATNVEHDFIPYHGFFTTVQFERGTGFIDRAQVVLAPYLAERNEAGAAS